MLRWGFRAVESVTRLNAPARAQLARSRQPLLELVSDLQFQRAV